MSSTKPEVPTPCGRFAERGEVLGHHAAANLPPCQGTAGKSVMLLANCFNFVLAPTASISVYKYMITPECTTSYEEQHVLEDCWSTLREKLSAFVVQSPDTIFAARHVQIGQTLESSACAERGFIARSMRISYLKKFSAQEVNAGVAGEVQVVFRFLVKQICKRVMHQKVGRRYFNNEDATDGHGQHVFAGFFAAMCSAATSAPKLLLDSAYRPKCAKNVLEVLAESPELNVGAADLVHNRDPTVQLLWRQACVGSTVVTTYNNRLYRIREVVFHKTPADTFVYFVRETKSTQVMTIADYLQQYYARGPLDSRQPLLEAYPEKDSEVVYLVPELCAFTGFYDELRRGKDLNQTMRQAKATPPERFTEIQRVAEGIVENCRTLETGPAAKLVKAWNVALQTAPEELQGRVLEPIRIFFKTSAHRDREQGYLAEGGIFDKSVRNGLLCPAKLEDWVLMCPEADTTLVKVWLRSVREIAERAFHMLMSEPKMVKVRSEDGLEELAARLKEHVKPTTQLVLLLTPIQGSTQLYRAFKQATCRDYPCITQVVNGETIRKRQSLAKKTQHILLQISAKCCGPLWQVDLRCTETEPAFIRPTMVIGVDVYVSGDREKFMGLAASMDPACTEYYSIAYLLDQMPEATSMSIKLQVATRDALLQFAQRNKGMLPEHLLVYRGSVDIQDFTRIEATEVEALTYVLDAIRKAAQQETSVRMTFVTVMKRSNIRFFHPTDSSGSRSSSPRSSVMQNPPAGTIIDSDAVRLPDRPSFFLTSQPVTEGCAVPAQFVVLYDSFGFPASSLQQLTYRLSFLYFNCTCSVRVPAPLQYATKIAQFVGGVLKFIPHKRLLRTLFYL